jgi:hypothetical protein
MCWDDDVVPAEQLRYVLSTPSPLLHRASAACGAASGADPSPAFDGLNETFQQAVGVGRLGDQPGKVGPFLILQGVRHSSKGDLHRVELVFDPAKPRINAGKMLVASTNAFAIPRGRLRALPADRSALLRRQRIRASSPAGTSARPLRLIDVFFLDLAGCDLRNA